MLKFFTLTWVLGLFTLVPYGIYYLFFEAARDEYALVGVSVLFWIFGYWGVAGPLIAAHRVYRLMQLFENIQNREQLKALIEESETQEAAIDLIASENKLPRFLARRIFNSFMKRFAESDSVQIEEIK